MVLGLSVTLVKQQVYGNTPAQTGFSAFAGGFGFLASIVGLACLWAPKIPASAALVTDTLAAVFYLAGGVVSIS